MKKHFIFLLLLCLPVEALWGASTPAFLKMTKDVPLEQQALIAQDLERLQRLPLALQNPEFNRVMDLSEGPVTTQNLLDWLSYRARIIVGSDFRIDDRTLTLARRGYAFEQPGIVPDATAMVQAESATDASANTVKTIMSNIGLPIYVDSKKAGELWTLKVPGRFSKIRVTSPRVGIIRIGTGLFESRRSQEGLYNPGDADSSYLRIAALFHEGRHSDGNGKTLGMTHQICPSGHDYAGFPACDFSLNGSYSVGAHITKAFAENCQDCSIAQREVLRLEYLDALSRVQREKVTLTDADRSDVEELEELQKACKFLEQQQQPLLASCSNIQSKITAAKTRARGNARIQKATFLDSRPEGTL